MRLLRKQSANYIRLIYQIDAGCRRPLWVGQRRTEACLRQGLRHLDAALHGVNDVCSDMWKPYSRVIAALLPHALNIHDRFQIAAHRNTAVDTVRRAEVTRLGGSKASAAGGKLRKRRWHLLRAGHRVRGKARARLNALIRAKGATARAWMLKESFEHYQAAKKRICRRFGRSGGVCFVGWFGVISFDSACTCRRAAATAALRNGFHSHFSATC